MRGKKGTIVFLLALLTLLLVACSETGSKDLEVHSMVDALDAVVEASEEELIYVGGMYIYPDQEAYDNEKPEYQLLFYKKELEENQVVHVSYRVGETVELIAEIPGFTSPEILEIHEQAGKVDHDEVRDLAGSLEDRTRQVLEMAKDEGYDLAQAAFSQGESIIGLYQGNQNLWFYVFRGEDNFQAAYRWNEDILILADSSDESLSTYGSTPIKGNSVYFGDVEEYIPEAGLTMEEMEAMMQRIEEGYIPDWMKEGKEPVDTYTVEIPEGDRTLQLDVYEDRSFVTRLK
ncbi:hypothetical protein J0B03_01300 [Alkalibacter rhizosphaerae]|uniref:Uncharacterized protein n=1 Tax=Alkalibacter rhizosphaerae TaxID=2815577 RepID=A0A974XF76_9FIRM|nr:hypothetical protein [Alkalibacter rhizosphaerae]QSX08757.1 hypothetical protein J0B03_01300 [Alkalibacter rhizosphaerae]